jgi:hypothetical protein
MSIRQKVKRFFGALPLFCSLLCGRLMLPHLKQISGIK